MCSDHMNAAAAVPTFAWIIHAVVGKSERERKKGCVWGGGGVC